MAHQRSYGRSGRRPVYPAVITNDTGSFTTTPVNIMTFSVIKPPVSAVAAENRQDDGTIVRMRLEIDKLTQDATAGYVTFWAVLAEDGQAAGDVPDPRTQTGYRFLFVKHLRFAASEARGGTTGVPALTVDLKSMVRLNVDQTIAVMAVTSAGTMSMFGITYQWWYKLERERSR